MELQIFPAALQGKVKSLDYRTLRYVGHYDWVRSKLREIQGDPDELNAIMQEEIPQVWDDNVVVYAGVRGEDDKGIFRAAEQSYHIKPMKVGKAKLKAIQTTTAGPLAQMALFLLAGKYKGVVLQSQIDTHEFLHGSIVKAIYNS